MSNLSLKFICSHSLEQLTSRFVVPAVGSVTKEENDLRLRADFEPLVDALVEKYRRAGNGEDTVKLPASLEEIRARFEVVYPSPAIVETCNSEHGREGLGSKISNMCLVERDAILFWLW